MLNFEERSLRQESKNLQRSSEILKGEGSVSREKRGGEEWKRKKKKKSEWRRTEEGEEGQWW